MYLVYNFCFSSVKNQLEWNKVYKTKSSRATLKWFLNINVDNGT